MGPHSEAYVSVEGMSASGHAANFMTVREH